MFKKTEHPSSLRESKLEFSVTSTTVQSRIAQLEARGQNVAKGDILSEGMYFNSSLATEIKKVMVKGKGVP